MLQFISTSSTIKEGDGDFNVDHTVSLLRTAMEGEKKKRGPTVGELLSALTERQRVEVRDSYVGPKSESLQVQFFVNLFLFLVLTPI